MEKLPRILLVDDDDTTNFLNEHLLNKLKVTDHIQITSGGEQALALLAEPPPYVPTLLLLDLAMPGMGGMEFLDAYLHLPQARRDATVIVVLATSMDARDMNRINDLPIAGLVSKPLTAEKINTLLQLHFNRQLPTE